MQDIDKAPTWPYLLDRAGIEAWVGDTPAEDQPGARVAPARASQGTQFYLYGFGCAAAQLEALRAAPATPPDLWRNHLERCRQPAPPATPSETGGADPDGP